VKRRRRSSAPTGSLDLLLDTICNAFGSIILIALLIVLLTADIPGSISEATDAPEQDEIERAIVNAEETIQSLQEEIDSLITDPEAIELGNLRSAVEDAKQRLTASQSSASENASDLPVDYSESIRTLRIAERENQIGIAAARNSLEARNKRQESLLQQLSRVQAETEEMVEARTQRFRLPKESTTQRAPINVIFLYNEIFWVTIQDRPNKDAIQFIERGKSTQFLPIRGRGDQLPGAENRTKTLLKEIESGEFLACYVFPDSVDSFRKFRELSYSSGVQIGWSLENDPDALVFSAEGSSPRPQ